MLRAFVPQHQRFPPEELQPCLGSEHDLARRAEFHDERGDDDRECERDGGGEEDFGQQDEVVE
jgi:hypothetical protein